MNKDQEKTMLDLQRLIKDQNFKTIEEAKKFMSQLTGKSIPVRNKKALTNEQLAQELVYEANDEYDLLVAEKKVFMALVHDPDCVEAFEYLAESSESPLPSMIFFKNAISAGRKKLGEKFLEENKGHFWILHETRPYMRCLLGYALALYALDQKEACIKSLKEMLVLNPNDNQGVRDYVMLFSLELLKLNDYNVVYKKYNNGSTAFALFNHALYSFLENGDNSISREALEKARNANKHVLMLLISKKELPELTETYGLGDKAEAIYYSSFARHVWQNATNAIEWLTRVYQKK